MKGYVRALQWYGSCKTYEDLVRPSRHTGDAAQVDQVLGFDPSHYPITMLMPACPVGHIVFEVADDYGLKVVRTNYDTSD